MTTEWRAEKQGKAGWLLIAPEFKLWLDKAQAQILAKHHNSELSETKAQRDELARELEWITRCAKKTDAVGITWYAIADEHMDAARAIVATL